MLTESNDNGANFVTWSKLWAILGLLVTISTTGIGTMLHFTLKGVHEALAQHESDQTPHLNIIQRSEYERRYQEQRAERRALQADIRALQKDLNEESKKIIEAISRLQRK